MLQYNATGIFCINLGILPGFGITFHCDVF